MRESLEMPLDLAARLQASLEGSTGEKTSPSAAEGLKLNAAFLRISSKPARGYLISLMEALASGDACRLAVPEPDLASGALPRRRRTPRDS